MGQQKQLANQILTDISKVNPYTSEDKSMAFIWAAGFLAGYIASLAEEDMFVYKRFKRHIEEQRLPKFKHR